MEYRILTGRAEDLERRVGNYLRDGWRLLGQPFRTGDRLKSKYSTSYFQLDAELAQAMTREEKNQSET